MWLLIWKQGASVGMLHFPATPGTRSNLVVAIDKVGISSTTDVYTIDKTYCVPTFYLAIWLECQDPAGLQLFSLYPIFL